MRLKKTVVAVALALGATAHQCLGAYMASSGMILHAVDPNDPEVKAAIKKAVEEATAEEREKNKKLLQGLTSKGDIKDLIEEAVAEAKEGLEKKNKELLSELKELKKGQQVDPAAVEKLERKIEEQDAQLTTANKEVKRLTGELGKTSKALEGESGFTQKLLIDNGLSDALVKSGVSNPTRLKASIAMLRGQVKVVAEGDVRKAMVGDKELGAFVTEWAASDEGKEFVTAKENSGGGAHKTPVNLKGVDISKLPPTERMNLARQANKEAGK